MSTRLAILAAVGIGLIVQSQLVAETFVAPPVLEIYVGNDSFVGPDTQNLAAQSLHIFNTDNIGGAYGAAVGRQVAYSVYNLGELKADHGDAFTDVNLYHVGYSPWLDAVDVYGVLEAYEHQVTDKMTWNTAPGVKKAARGSPVELERSQLTSVLVSFTPKNQIDEQTENSEALAQFLSSDTNGRVVLLFASPAQGKATVLLSYRSRPAEEDCGVQIIGDIHVNPRRAQSPIPADGEEDVYRATDLRWTPAEGAVTRNVYLSTDFADVSAGRATALVAQGWTANVFAPAQPLALGATYYWRVDEANPSLTPSTYVGAVWSFTVEPEVYPIAPIGATASSFLPGSQPGNTIDGSGLEYDPTLGLTHSTQEGTMWLTAAGAASPHWIQFEFDRPYSLFEMLIWNHNSSWENILCFGAKDVTIETSVDGIDWMGVPGVSALAQAPGEDHYAVNNTVALHMVRAKHVRITITSSHAANPSLATAGLSEVRFTTVPTQARVRAPVDGGTQVPIDTELSWRAGRGATEHRVYLGTDANAVATCDTGVLLGTLAGDEIAAGGLDYDTTYYWRVDAVNDAGVVAGPVWRFTTPEYYVIDDFDQYDDACNRIFWTWLDGGGYSDDGGCSNFTPFAGNGSNSYVGNADAPFAERTVTHEGSFQSMPLEYDNSVSPYYSAAYSKDYVLPRDWTKGGVNTLNIYLRGYPGAFTAVSPDHLIIGSSGGADVLGTSDDFRYVYKPLNGDGSLVARVLSIEDTDQWARAGVMIRASLDADSQWIQMLVSTRNGARLHQRLAAGAAVTTDTALLAADSPQRLAAPPAWIKLERQGNQFKGYYAMDEASPEWIPAAGNPQELAMPASAYIGLAVFSSNGNVATVAEFTNVATTVSGSWQAAAIGPEQPSNSAEKVYLTVKDGANHSKTLVHPSAAATQMAAWTPWSIPLTDLNGVNLSDVKQLTLGVGDSSSPVSGGAGMLFVDTIRLSVSED